MHCISDRIIRTGTVWIMLVATTGAAEPKIIKMEPSEGIANQTIKLIGENLSRTRFVHFLVGYTDRTASFRVVSNSELDVIVPEFYRPKAEALIVLQHDEGVVLTCPVTETLVRENGQRIPGEHHPSAKASLVHVIHGGVINTASVATVVEEGGIVSAVDDHSPLVLVKNGGRLGAPKDHSSYRRGRLYYEPSAKLANEFLNPKHRWTLVPVKRIHLAEGIGPFVFQPSVPAQGLDVSSSVPEITAVTPATVTSGDIITVRGKGFSGTTKVFVTGGAATEVGFRIVSDNELRVETSDGYAFGHAEVMVVNSKGLALTLSPAPPTSQQRAGIGLYQVKLVHVTQGMVVTEREAQQFSSWPLYLVESGGIVTNRGSSGVFVVKSGGTIDVANGKVFHEPGASVPAGLGVRDAIEVPTIRVSRLVSGLEFIHPAKK